MIGGVQVPPSSGLADISAFIGFIRLISTSEGLQKAVDELAEKQKAIENANVELRKQRDANAAELAQIATERDEANAIIKQANDKNLKAQEQFNAANERLELVAQKEKELVEKTNSTTADLDKRSKALALAEQKAQQDQANADAEKAEAAELKKLYEDKLAELKNITNN